MGILSDVGAFEKVNLSDMWRKLREDPERAFIGAIDPLSSWMWGEVTGKDYEPIINQLGGPAGDGPLATGNTGGVYAKAQEKGVNTGASAASHDVAELIASIYGGQGAVSGIGNAFGGGASAASGAGSGSTGLLSPGDAAALDAASASANMSGTAGVSSASNMGMATPAAGTNWGQVMNQSMGLLGSAGGGQQQQQPSIVTQPAQPRQQDQSQQQRAVEMQRIRELQYKQKLSADERRELQALQTRNNQTVIR